MAEDHKLTALQLAVLLRVAYRAGPPDGECYEKQSGIAKAIRYPRQRVNGALKDLVSLGLLTGLARHRQPTIYRLILVSPRHDTRPAQESLCHDVMTPTRARGQSLCHDVMTPTGLKKRRRGGETSPSDTPPPRPVPEGKGMQGEGGGLVSPRHDTKQADTIRAILKKYEGVHGWRIHEAGVRTYLRDPDKLKVDVAGWERRAKPAYDRRPVKAQSRYY